MDCSEGYGGDTATLDFASNQSTGFECHNIGYRDVDNSLADYELVSVGGADSARGSRGQ